VLLFAVVLDDDSPLRKRRVNAGNEDSVAIEDVELRHHVRTTLISQYLDEEGLHLTLRRSAVGVPRLERGPERLTEARFWP